MTLLPRYYTSLNFTPSSILSHPFPFQTSIASEASNPYATPNAPANTFNPQDGKPYILSLAAGPAYDDVRSQGFTLVARSEFKDLEDMKFYDDGCEAHQELKKGVKTLNNEGVMTV